MDVGKNEQELSSVESSSTTVTDMISLAYLSLTEKEKALSPRYLAEKDSFLKKFLEWEGQDQTDFIQICLQKMRHQQHGQIDLFLKPMLQRDFITLLPTGLAENVLSMLDAKSLCACAHVSKSWRRAIAHGMLWRKLIERKVRTDSLWKGLSEKRGWKKFLFISKEQATYLISLTHGMSKIEAEEMKRNYPDPLEFQHLFYRNMYPQIERDITAIENNWRNGNHHLQRINCQSENSKGVYCLQYDDEKIVSGLRDNTIKIWNRNDLSCTKVLTGHTGSVLCLQYDDRVIASGSSDATVRIWDVQTGQQLNALIHHCEAVLHLRFQNGMLVTCSKDRSIAVWNMISPQEIDLRRVLVGHRAAVNVVDFDQTYIVSASGDRTIKVWSADTCEFVRTLNGHRRGIACLQYRDRLIVSGSSDNSIRLWDIESGACLRVLEGHEELVRCIRFDSKRIVSGAYDGKIKVWDLQAALDPRSSPSSINLRTLVAHTGRVFRLQFDEFQIVSSSHDDTILIWDFLNTPSNAHLPGSVAPAAGGGAHHRRAAPIDGMFNDAQVGNIDFGADPGVGMGGLNIPGPLLPLQADDDWDQDAHMQPMPGPAGDAHDHNRVARMRVNHNRPRLRVGGGHRPIGDVRVEPPQENFPQQINIINDDIFQQNMQRINQQQQQQPAAAPDDIMDDSEDSAEDVDQERNHPGNNNLPNLDGARQVNDDFFDPADNQGPELQ